MRIPLYQVDAFASATFSGNPAAVCPLERWLDERTLQAIGAENNLSETAFFVPRGEGFEIRWFTPLSEVTLCGHATLASAWVLFHRLGTRGERVKFESKGGPLTVTRRGELLELDFPVWKAAPAEVSAALVEGLGARPREAFLSQDLMAVFESAEEILALKPRADVLSQFGARGVMATAPGGGVPGAACDYVLRFFAPGVGIPEDPATGSAHCTLVPYWAKRLGRTRLTARQLSPRGAEFECEHRGERVGIGGRVAPYLEGTIEIAD